MEQFAKEWIKQNKKAIEQGEDFIVMQQKEIRKIKRRIKIIEQLDKANETRNPTINT